MLHVAHTSGDRSKEEPLLQELTKRGSIERFLNSFVHPHREKLIHNPSKVAHGTNKPAMHQPCASAQDASFGLALRCDFFVIVSVVGLSIYDLPT